MALNISTLKTRSLTALIFVVVMLCGLLINSWSFFILFTIIHFGCWFEFHKIMGLIYKPYQNISIVHKFIVMLGGWGFMLYAAGDGLSLSQFSLNNLGFILMCILGVGLPIVELLLSKNKNFKVVLISVLGLIYISVSWALLINIHGSDYGKVGVIKNAEFIGLVFCIILISSIWINDTMAYLVGSLIGKTPLSSISPKKTWEGTIGGAILCILVMGFVIAPLIYEKMFDFQLGNEAKFLLKFVGFAIAAIAAIIGTLGDLLESKLKRMANIKDSGSFMPGHGGFLDRFDSLIVATPFVWIFIQLFVKL